ncbi:MAG: hypothetical protein ABIM89_18915, partial [Mycobacteriales bacterium]
DISYGLYLFHIPVMFLVLPWVSPRGTRFGLGMCLTLLVLVPVAWASHRFVEQPARRACRRWLAGRPTRTGADVPVPRRPVAVVLEPATVDGP